MSPQIQYCTSIAELVSTRQVVTHTVTLTARHTHARTHTAAPARGRPAIHASRWPLAKRYALVGSSVENISLLIPSKAPTGARSTSRRRIPR